MTLTDIRHFSWLSAAFSSQAPLLAHKSNAKQYTVLLEKFWLTFHRGDEVDELWKYKRADARIRNIGITKIQITKNSNSLVTYHFPNSQLVRSTNMLGTWCSPIAGKVWQYGAILKFLEGSAQPPWHNSLFPLTGRDSSSSCFFRFFATIVRLLFLKIIFNLQIHLNITREISKTKTEMVLTATSSQLIGSLPKNQSHLETYLVSILSSRQSE